MYLILTDEKLYTFPSGNLEQKYKSLKDVKRYKLSNRVKSQNLDRSDPFSESNIQNTKLFFKNSQEIRKTDFIEKTDLSKKLYFWENSNTNLLVEAAIRAAEKDLNEQPTNNVNNSCSNVVPENRSEMYTINQNETNSLDVDGAEGRTSRISDRDLETEIKTFPEDKILFFSKDKNEDFKSNTFLRVNASPLSEIKRNLSTPVRDNDSVSLTSVDIENSQDKVMYNEYKSPDELQPDRFEFYKESGFDRSPMIKFSYRDDGFQNERRVLDKCKNFDIQLCRLKEEEYIRESYEKTEEDEEEVEEVQNLCLKEKSYQCENLDDLAKAERDSSGFENILHGDVGRINIQNFSSPLFRGSHGIISPRSYPTPFDTETVDLSVRPSFSSSPIYSLDLTPSRVDFSARHLDFRNHFGLPPFRFESPTCGTTSESGRVSPTNYGLYQYANSGQRTCQGSQFQPYSSIYY